MKELFLMVALHLTGRITEDRQLIIDLPANAPIGAVDVVIQPQAQPEPEPDADTLAEWRARREYVREKMRAAGILGEAHMTLDAIELPDIKLPLELPPGARASLDYINEDREDRV